MASFVEVTTLVQPVCPDCHDSLAPVGLMSLSEAEEICRKHDALEHTGFNTEGEDG
jgi:hypothetical protein